MSLISESGQWVLNLVFPKECVCCGKKLSFRDRVYLCLDCYQRLVWINDPVCQVCGRPLPGLISVPETCADCRDDPPYFHRLRSVWLLRESGHEWILSFKYRQSLFLAAPAVGWLKEAGDRFLRCSDYDGILSVPLHHRKARERGYNQSGLLASGLSRLTKIPLAKKALIRTRYTRTQTRLNREERCLNVKGAFKVGNKKKVEGKSLLILDDVFTTGATLNECARVLKKAGARQVDALTLARAG